MQRAHGRLILGFRARSGVTALARLRQEGCLKARFPRPAPGAWAGAVLLNTSGGVTGGDDLQSALTVGAGARATFAGQAAERLYRALPDAAPARVAVSLHVAAGACAEWLPQETILFDGCALDRTLDVHLAVDAGYLGVESLVFGRARSGETLSALRLRDRVRLFRGGRLLLLDAVAFAGPAATLATAACLGPDRACATVLCTGSASGRLDAVRDAIGGAIAGGGGFVRAGASVRDGVLCAKLLASDAQALRSAVVAVLAVLRHAPLPRVWTC